MNTKQKGDIAEYRVVSELLARGHDVLIPCGDRLPYDIGVDANGRLLRIQVKSAWRNRNGTFSVDVRRSQTNRKVYKITKYDINDFDFLIACVMEESAFFIIPSIVACSYGGRITLLVHGQRVERSREYKGRWDLLENRPPSLLATSAIRP